MHCSISCFANFTEEVLQSQCFMPVVRDHGKLRRRWLAVPETVPASSPALPPVPRIARQRCSHYSKRQARRSTLAKHGAQKSQERHDPYGAPARVFPISRQVPIAIQAKFAIAAEIIRIDVKLLVEIL